MTEEELCDFLHVSREAVYRFRSYSEDPIPYLRAGRRYLYEQDQVLKWLRREGQRDRAKKKVELKAVHCSRRRRVRFKRSG